MSAQINAAPSASLASCSRKTSIAHQHLSQSICLDLNCLGNRDFAQLLRARADYSTVQQPGNIPRPQPITPAVSQFSPFTDVCGVKFALKLHALFQHCILPFLFASFPPCPACKMNAVRLCLQVDNSYPTWTNGLFVTNPGQFAVLTPIAEFRASVSLFAVRRLWPNRLDSFGNGCLAVTTLCRQTG